MNLPHFFSRTRHLVALTALLFASGCATLDHSAPTASLDRAASWVILPVANQADTPQAGLRLETLLDNHLRSRGVQTLQHYPASMEPSLLLDPSERTGREQAIQWAKTQGARYGVTGTVSEWRYKTGVDGEPVVGISLQIVHIDDGKIVYSASGAKSGWSREALSAVAQKLTRELLAPAGL
ncbi:MAG: penicillin-binding protein activator LpoB [Thiobacillus sp.]